MPFLSYVLCHIMTLKRMLAESAVEKIMSAFVTRAVRFVIFKTAVFAMEWVKPSVKSAFWGIIFFCEKNMVSNLKAFEMICKYYLFFRNFDIDFFAPMVYNKTKGVRRCHSVTFKTTE